MKRLISFFTKVCESYLPDAFVFCLLLTLIVFISAIFLTPHTPLTLIEFWGKDFWGLNAFAMQMVFVLITGHMLATTPLVKKGLALICNQIKSEKEALIFLSVFSTFCCWLNWGLGPIVSSILAIELAKKIGKVNFGLFIATAYSGFLVWHGGLSGTIPLKIAGKDEILTRIYPDLSIPLSSTIFSNYNLLILVLLFIFLPVTVLMMRTDEKTVLTFSETPMEAEVETHTLRDELSNSRWPNIIFFIFFFIVILKLPTFDFSSINFIFLSLSMLLHGTPAKFLKALQSSVGSASGIIIQFPFYAGIMGLMQYSGLVNQMSSFFVEISTKETLPLLTFLSAGLVNFFIPSGGGQWVVQGPVMLKASQSLGVDPGKISMAMAWGDAWTNMIQPFWTLPLLGLAKIQLKDIMGYCLVITIVSGIIITSVFFFI